MWTIFDSRGKALAGCEYEPDQGDLASRGEQAVWHQEAIGLDEIMLVGGGVKRKPNISLSAAVNGLSASISVGCEDNGVTDIPLIIGGVCVVKPPGCFVLTGEAGLNVVIDFERDLFRGECLKVAF